MSTELPLSLPASPSGGVRWRQCAVALAAASAACLATVAVLLAMLVLAPSLLPRLLLRPHHVVPSVAGAELRLLAFDAAASTVAYNLSATLRFGSPGLRCRYTALRAAPFYAGQRLGAAASLPGFTQRGGGAREVAAAALKREEAQGTVSVKVALSTVQNGARSDFACVLSFPAARRRRRRQERYLG